MIMRMKREEQAFYNKESGKGPIGEFVDGVNLKQHPSKLLPLFSHKRDGSYNPRNSIQESDLATNVAQRLDNTVESSLH